MFYASLYSYFKYGYKTNYHEYCPHEDIKIAYVPSLTL